MRLFVGIALPPEVSAIVAAKICELQPLAISAGLKLSWVPEAKLHVTTKFIGEFPQERLPALEQVLAGIRVSDPVAIHLLHLDCFPGALFAKVEPTRPLLTLASATDAILEPLGIQREKLTYRPHITLARLRSPHRATLRALPSTLKASFPATSFHLYLSASGQYTKLKEFPLQTDD